MTQVLNQISKLPTYEKVIVKDQDKFKPNLMIDDLVDSLECYLDKDNETFCLSKFLKVNSKLLLAPNDILGKDSLKFWNMLFQMLLQSENEANKVACHIIADFKGIHFRFSS